MTSLIPQRARHGLRAVLLLGVLLPPAGTGCRGPRNFENVNDDLRRQNLELQTQVRDLQDKLQLAAASVENLQQRLAQTQPATPARIPAPVDLRLERYSGILDTDNNGSPDLLRLYVKPRDYRGRFVPLVGSLNVQIVRLAPDQQPLLLFECTLSPQELDDRYRSTWMGNHYTIEAPFTAPQPPPNADATVKLTFTDAIAGSTITCQQPLPLLPPPR